MEKELANIPDLNYTILRPALVYGIGDKHGMTTRIIIAAIYKQLSEAMKLLWNSDLHLNTIHVLDFCHAIWLVSNRKDTLGKVTDSLTEFQHYSQLFFRFIMLSMLQTQLKDRFLIFLQNFLILKWIIMGI